MLTVVDLLTSRNLRLSVFQGKFCLFRPGVNINTNQIFSRATRKVVVRKRNMSYILYIINQLLERQIQLLLINTISDYSNANKQ